MEEKIIKDTRDVIEKSIKALEKENSSLLKDFSNQTVHNCSIYQDKCSLSTTYIIYSISKIVEINKTKLLEDWNKLKQNLLTTLNKALNNLKANNLEGYLRITKEIISQIHEIDKLQSVHRDDVLHSSKIKKGALLARHGISLARISSLLGISEWELMSYLGNTKYLDTSDKKLIERLKLTRSLFNTK